MIFEKIQQIIMDQFGLEADAVTEETGFVSDIGADSLDVVELAMTVEETFDIGEISEEDIRSIQTVGDLVAYVSRKKA